MFGPTLSPSPAWNQPDGATAVFVGVPIARYSSRIWSITVAEISHRTFVRPGVNPYIFAAGWRDLNMVAMSACCTRPPLARVTATAHGALISPWGSPTPVPLIQLSSSNHEYPRPRTLVMKSPNAPDASKMNSLATPCI